MKEAGAKKLAPKAMPSTTKRVSLEDQEDRFDIIDRDNLDTDFHYHWVYDAAGVEGAKIEVLKQRGYMFVQQNEVEVAKAHVFDTPDDGTIIRKPSGSSGGYLYLMKQPMEFYLEDKEYKAKKAKAAVSRVYENDELEELKEGLGEGNVTQTVQKSSDVGFG